MMKDIASLGKIDLNLLISFQVLIEEQSVSRAAERLFITQSAMSRTLQRLRALFDDPLFIRISHGLKPTHKALLLSERLRPALEGIAKGIDVEAFEPASSEGQFTIASSAMINTHWLPTFLRVLNRSAPGIHIRTMEVSTDFEKQIVDGNLDFAIYPARKHSAEFTTQHLIEIHPICLCRTGHPITQHPLTAESYLRYTHVNHYVPVMKNRVDAYLHKKYGAGREIGYEGQDLSILLDLVRDSDLLITVPDTMRVGGDSLTGLTVMDCTSVFGKWKIDMELVLTTINASDPAYEWIASSIVDAFQMPPPATPRAEIE
jgi:DNA-binding transcriptional LysR family regulator